MTEAEQFRAALTPKVEAAMWTELERQHHSADMFRPYVDPESAIIDGEIDMTAVANAAIDTVLTAFSPPF